MALKNNEGSRREAPTGCTTGNVATDKVGTTTSDRADVPSAACVRVASELDNTVLYFLVRVEAAVTHCSWELDHTYVAVTDSVHICG
jgi:hypothetical protein